MAAPLGTARARTRAHLTGENLQQARELVAGPDGVPDAAHPDQLTLEAAILTELDDLYAGEDHPPLDGIVYGITRVRPTHETLSLHLGSGRWESILEWLLPEPASDLDIEGLTVSGIPGLRARALPPRRIELFRPDTRASVILDLPAGNVREAHQWVEELPRSGEPMRSAEDWTGPERASLAAYEDLVGDAAARSAVLRRLLAFRHLPVVRLVDPSGDVPSRHDFQQLLAARQQPPRQPSPQPPQFVPPRLQVHGARRPVVLAVVSGHLSPGAGLGGQGRTTCTAQLASALARHGERVLVVDTDSHQPLGRGRHTKRLPRGVSVTCTSPEPGPLKEALAQAAADGQDIVLLDAAPQDQHVIAQAADGWLGVAALWPSPEDHPLLTTETLGADGRPLPDGREHQWLAAMRAERWAVTWRLAPRNGEAWFAPFDQECCAGVVLLGTRETPGARASDIPVRGWPLLQTAIPYNDGHPRSRRCEHEAYHALAAELLGG